VRPLVGSGVGDEGICAWTVNRRDSSLLDASDWVEFGVRGDFAGGDPAMRSAVLRRVAAALATPSHPVYHLVVSCSCFHSRIR